MKQTVYDKQTGVASQHWPVDVMEILERGGGRYTVDPSEVEGNVTEPQLAEAPSAEEEAELQLAEAQSELAEASAALAEQNEAESERLKELGEMEQETGEPITPQVYPTHFLDEEQANYPSDWKYRRHAVSDYGQPQPTADVKRRPSVATVYGSDQEQRRDAALAKARRAQDTIRAQQAQQGQQGGQPRGSGQASQAVQQRKQQLDQKKQESQAARDQRKQQREQEKQARQQEREQRKQEREAARAKRESESQ